jgi:hypothetical protein
LLSGSLADKNFALFRENPQHPSLDFRKKGGVYTAEIGRSYRAWCHPWFPSGPGGKQKEREVAKGFLENQKPQKSLVLLR